MEIKEASKKKRLLNFIVDIVAIVILVAISDHIGSMLDYHTPFKILGFIIILGGYYIPMEFLLGKTVGKFVTNSKVVNADGSKISLRTAVLRFVCRWIPFEYVSLALGADARAWHDSLTKTYVVDDE